MKATPALELRFTSIQSRRSARSAARDARRPLSKGAPRLAVEVSVVDERNGERRCIGDFFGAKKDNLADPNPKRYRKNTYYVSILQYIV